MKKYTSLLIPLLLIILSVLVLSISAYLLYFHDVENDYEIGDVDAAVRVYFSDGDPNTPEEDETYFFTATNPDQESDVKMGIVKVNISNPDSVQFVKNLRADVIVKSNIDTYIRVAPFIQYTLTYSAHGVTYEKALTQDDYFRLNYNFDLFYDNRTADSYFYLYNKVRKIGVSDVVIPLIEEYFDEEFKLYEDHFSLQIGFIIEAVQYIEGPLHNWGQEKAPWGDNWEDVESIVLNNFNSYPKKYDLIIHDERKRNLNLMFLKSKHYYNIGKV